MTLLGLFHHTGSQALLPPVIKLEQVEHLIGWEVKGKMGLTRVESCARILR